MRFNIIFFLSIFFSALVQAQDELAPEMIKLQNLTVKDGLSQSNVNGIVKDHEGFLWIATDDGLNRFDSYEFKVFKHDEKDTTTLSDSKVWCILEDHKGRIWAGTNQGGLNLFDKKNNTFRRFKNDPKDKNTITPSGVYCLREDSRNTLWVGTFTGLNAFDVDNNVVKRYTSDDPKGKSLRDYRIHAILEDHEHNIWIGSNGGVGVLDPKTDSIQNFSFDAKNKHSISANRVRAIFEDSENNIWIGTDGGGANLFDRKTGTFTRFRHDPLNANSISADIVRYITEDENGNIWFGTDGKGISVYSKKEKKFINLESKDDPSFVNTAVYVLYKDADGILWIGTYGEGVKVLNKKRKNFIHYEYFDEAMEKLGKNSVLAIAEDHEKNVWIGTDGSGLFRFNPQTKQFEHFLYNPHDPFSISSNVIKSLMIARDGKIYAGTYAGGLNIFDPRTKKFSHFIPEPGDSDAINSYHIWALYQDSEDRIWVGTLGGGLHEFLPEKKIFRHFVSIEDDTTTLSVNFVSKIFEDSRGEFWVATEDGGINKMNRKTGTFKRYMFKANNKPGIGPSNNFIRDVFEDHNGKIWLGTNGGGLNFYDPENDVFRTFENADIDEAILGILEDDENRLWLSSYNGLYKFDPATGTTRIYDVYDGLQGNEFNANAKLKTSDGHFYFGGLNGLNIFKPEQITENTVVPAIALTDFYFFHNQDEKLAADVNQLKNLTLYPGQNVFSLKYALLDFNFPKKNRYAYKLEGFDKDWNKIGQERIATYTNIPPGEYVFKVIGANNDGIWNEAGKQLHIKVVPPWYQKSYAIFLLLFFILFLIAAIIKIRTTLLLKQTKKLEELVRTRTHQILRQKTEIENKNKALSQRNEKIMRQNEELKQKNEEIFFQQEKVKEKSFLLERAHIEIKKANEELKRINSDLEQLVDTRTAELKDTVKKLTKADEELNMFIYRSSHDLRGPITSLMGLSQLIKKEVGNPGLDRYFFLLDRSCEHMLKLLKKLNDANTVFKSKREISKIFWSQILDEVVNELKVLDPEGDVKIEIDNQIKETIFSDPYLIKLIILNVMENSLIFRNGFGKQSFVRIELTSENSTLKIHIKDNGKGIEPKVKEKLFNLFYRGSEASIGNGLGLYLVQKSVDLLCGNIMLESKVNEFTHFSINIPIAYEGKNLYNPSYLKTNPSR